MIAMVIAWPVPSSSSARRLALVRARRASITMPKHAISWARLCCDAAWWMWRSSLVR